MMRFLVPVLLLAAAPASAQRTEVGAFGGYSSAGDIHQKALGIETLEVAGSFTWGLEASRFFSDHLGATVSWTRQESALRLGTASGSADLFEMSVSLLHASFAYRFGGPHATLAPYVLAGAGATFLNAEDLDGETKLSFGLGAGLRWLPSKRAGARLQARWVPTLLNDTSSDFCDPFGFCQGSLQQFELTGAVVLRF